MSINENTNTTEKNEKTVEPNTASLDVSKLELARYNFDKEHKNDKEVRKRAIKLYAKRLFFMFLSALIFNFGVNVFLTKAQTIPSGISGISMLIVLLWPNTNPYFALMYLATNIPLFLFYGFKIKKSFTFLTLAFMLFQIITNFIFTIEAVHNWIDTYINIAPGWKSTIEAGSVFYDNPVVWPVFLNGLIGSVFLGGSIALAWKFGGSTGGTDFIAYYYSTKKKKSISSVLMIVSFVTSLSFLLIFAFVKPHGYAVEINSANTYEFKKYHVIIGMREVMTVLYIIIVNIMVSLIFPKYKKVSLEISCSDPNKVLDYFKSIKYWHAYVVYKAKSGYNNCDTYKIETTLLLLELRSVVADIQVIDPKVWIRVKPVYKTLGSFNTKYVDE